jgi:hypothetical protein
MMGCVCGYASFITVGLIYLFSVWTIRTREGFNEKGCKVGVTRVLGYRGVLRLLLIPP